MRSIWMKTHWCSEVQAIWWPCSTVSSLVSISWDHLGCWFYFSGAWNITWSLFVCFPSFLTKVGWKHKEDSMYCHSWTVNLWGPLLWWLDTVCWLPKPPSACIHWLRAFLGLMGAGIFCFAFEMWILVQIGYIKFTASSPCRSCSQKGT